MGGGGYKEGEGDQGIMSKAQVTKASKIFGMEYLESMDGDGTGGTTAMEAAWS